MHDLVSSLIFNTILCVISEANTAQSPYKKLKEALSSVEAFEKHYLVSMVCQRKKKNRTQLFTADLFSVQKFAWEEHQAAVPAAPVQGSSIF